MVTYCQCGTVDAVAKKSGSSEESSSLLEIRYGTRTAWQEIVKRLLYDTKSEARRQPGQYHKCTDNLLYMVGLRQLSLAPTYQVARTSQHEEYATDARRPCKHDLSSGNIHTCRQYRGPKSQRNQAEQRCDHHSAISLFIPSSSSHQAHIHSKIDR